MAFETNVFINCPFDTEYKSLLKSMVFTVLYLQYEPQLSQTISSSNIRIEQIKKLIKNCQYGIHDLSRSKPMEKGDLPRFNMPYELGIDTGALEYGSGRLKNKKILILETERFHYQKVISDIAGQDIENHDDDPKTLIEKIRNWFSKNSENNYPGATKIWNAYNQFLGDLEVTLIANFTKKEIYEMPIGDFINYAKDWIKAYLQD